MTVQHERLNKKMPSMTSKNYKTKLRSHRKEALIKAKSIHIFPFSTVSCEADPLALVVSR